MNNPIQIDYSDAKLRIFVEEYITMQRREFTFKSVCSDVRYRATEEGRTAGLTLYESNELQQSDQERIGCVLKKIVSEGRITAYSDGSRYVNINE